MLKIALMRAKPDLDESTFFGFQTILFWFSDINTVRMGGGDPCKCHRLLLGRSVREILLEIIFVCRTCPISFEPSGTDFLSPCIQVGKNKVYPFLDAILYVSFVSHWLQGTGCQSSLSDRRQILWPGCLKTTLFSGSVKTFQYYKLSFQKYWYWNKKWF